MKTEAEKIVSQIKALVDELGAMSSGKSPKTPEGRKKVATEIPKGASGALNMFLSEGFFDTPKDIARVMEKLTEIGHYHKQTAVGMNLLNLTKRRILNRFKNKDKKIWEYVIRK